MNKTNLFAAMTALAVGIGWAGAEAADSPQVAAGGILPRPVSIDMKDGRQACFDIAKGISVSYSGVPASERNRISEYMDSRFGVADSPAGKSRGRIEFSIVDSLPGDSSPEGYVLDIAGDGVHARATSAAGLFYAAHSLAQLADTYDGKIPECSIVDYPRFQYRGLMIDVSRNFRDKNFIKKQIDAMAALKLNRLHLHLTDAAGWRMQIDRYPRLTEFAAWRKGGSWKNWDNKYCEATDPEATGGFYTKDDLRDIIRYAADRYITVIPEIEMPGHSAEVLAAYPELSCTGEPYKHHEFCPGNEATYEFLQNVLDEVIEVFPSEYIHIGGDEAAKDAWKKCPKCTARMADEGIKDVDGLQSYLIHRIDRYLDSKGRTLLGWDEIMEGGVAPGAAVLSWRGFEPGVKAASAGHATVMAPGRFCYFDGYQDAPATQPEAIGGYLPLELVYSFDPAPDSLSVDVKEHIKGVEATLFTEYIATDDHAEYMLYPRLLALAEVAWTPQSLKEYDNFYTRALAANDRLARDGYNVFDMRSEVGNRKEALAPVSHLALNKNVVYNDCNWSKSYPAAEAKTLTDGLRGGWNYNDFRWQG
ncbi:beta-N-acetylhexosaminidase, partial [Muribaculum intestinale]|uniref:beta-N-acetylhexosaminidase n=1 Tax=Muribaculum intestinale TaxID=1796646 RepID=UPI0025B5C64C